MGFRRPSLPPMPSAEEQMRAQQRLQPTAPTMPTTASAFSNPFSASFNYYRRNPALIKFAPRTGRPPAAVKK